APARAAGRPAHARTPRRAAAATGLAGGAAAGGAAAGAAGPECRVLPLSRERRMTWVLVRKVLREVRWMLLAVALLLGAFQFLWAKITERILGQTAPFLNALGEVAGLSQLDLEEKLFEGSGKITRTIMGGEQVHLDRAMDMLSIGYV